MNGLFKNCFGHKVKIQLIRESKPVKNYQIMKASDAYELVREELETSDREIFIVVSLNTKNKVLGLDVVSIGNISASLVHPREVFKSAILLNAASIIMMHNHPSGEPEPSKDDISITNRLVNAGKLLGINVLDHVIVANKYFSFLEKGLIEHRQEGGD